ncbi:hypothetical protein N7530_010555 [Penicillium desertorum]|uniref:Uncharacterized protein n=1 Tax=Penicillium desertorum TaxID=1303715 RepID=A0A9X0BHQ6_9EURO|nr:hypothetical protein N7530_010555 [Penicillium desertorum]
MLSRWNSWHQLEGGPRIAGKKQHFGVLGMRVLVINRRLKEEQGRLQVRDKHDINISMLQLAEGHDKRSTPVIATGEMWQQSSHNGQSCQLCFTIGLVPY